VSSELGGEEARRELVAALRAAGLALLVDIVPNHTGVRVPRANRPWWDVLRRGPSSAVADWFDIDWSSGPLVIPVLEDDPGAPDELKVADGELRYHEHAFPLADGTGGGTPQEVHERQHYRLVSWRLADTALNYRRFFAVNDLAGLRIEEPAVFASVHGEVLRWHAAGELDGLRVDHPDGLRDPGGYFAALRAAAPGAWIVAEKILEPGEDLPDWPIEGTTGYEALGEVCGLFVDAAAEPAFTALDASLIGAASDWDELAYHCKREVATGMLAAEVIRLARFVPDVPDAESALAEVLACFPVYRSYLPDGAERLRAALAAAGRRRPELLPALAALGPRLADPAAELARRFQQVSGAVMAKGVEDSAFYRWSRFVALNEVGGDPSRFGAPVPDFHAACLRRQERWPDGMTTLSTHDTKRSEDVRARLAVLSEIPSEWSSSIRRWIAAAPLPDPAYAHLLWQTLIGAWPIPRERLTAYAIKAGREGRVWTSWEDPDPPAEDAVAVAIDHIYDSPGLRASVDAFAARITPHGWSNSLGQKLVQLTMPGVPDTYQGTELWDNSLVDPDNRRPLEFAARRELLARLDSGWLPGLDHTGAVKLLVTCRALRLRRDAPALFNAYRPLEARGPAADHVIAFDRGGAIVVATRLPVCLERSGGWRDTTLPLPSGEWRDALTGRSWRGDAPLTDLLARYPVALLARP
ncbi:MAG: malto-oligosyltrehalose synthase, partial [Micromonosporaceae bacterium]|nr:malto-oligosyltrehalose synthase [Micromonosporaceae bacterium]